MPPILVERTVAPRETDRLALSLAQQEGAALLESGPGYGDLGRFSIYAAHPRATFTIRGSQWNLAGDAPLPSPPASADPWQALRQLLQATAGPQATPTGISPAIFQGGWIGFFGYDLAPLIEKLPRRHPPSPVLPDAHLAYYDTFALHDRLHDKLTLTAVDRFGEGPAAQKRRLEKLAEALNADSVTEDPGGPIVDAEPQSDFFPDDFCAAVAQVVDYLRAGDIFQANLSQQFSARLVATPEVVFGRARKMSPAPFSALLRANGWSLISTSPERFLLKTPGGLVETRPIKGTRPRGRDPIHDLLLRDELILSAKDAAELTMIVDLERNDLARVCAYSTVRVREHRGIESFANVHHAVSTIEGQLREGKDIVDLLLATFPGGSITGAPKIRAMEIIDELERGCRGPYTGAIGYISDHGRMDLNIAIRTIAIEEDRLSYRVGGGIVADSRPLEEYRETLVKGGRLRALLLGED